jgi:hypothetical protein
VLRSSSRFSAKFVRDADALRRAVFLGLGLNGVEAVGIVAHYAVDSGGSEKAHVGGMIHRPADDLQIVTLGFGDHRGRDEVAADDELAGADFQGFFDGLFDLTVTQKACHERWFGAPDSSY